MASMNPKKYILLGTQKIMQDFMYIYREMQITMLVSIDEKVPHENNYRGVPITLFADFDFRVAEEVIVCIRPGEERKKYAALLKEGNQQIQIRMCETYFRRYDNGISDFSGKKVYVWGTGRSAETFVSNCDIAKNIEGYIDSYKQISEFKEKPVITFEKIKKEKDIFIVIAVNNCKQIEETLRKHGYEHDRDYARWGEILWNPANMLKKVFFSQDRYDFACDTMLNHLEISGWGNTRTCCTTFVKADIGNYLDNDLSSIWNGKKSIVHQILALSTQNRTYAYCDKTMCPLFEGRKKEKIETAEINPYNDISDYPEVVAVGFDKTCNLACETCRDRLYGATGEEKRKAEQIGEKICDEILPHCKFLIMAGDGEVFASPAYKRIWNGKEIQQVKYIRLLSNGTLFNRENWERFAQANAGAKVMLTVSIDAATPATYETIRRYGNFNQLKENMKYAGELRAKGKLAYFRMNFVVQKKNMEEMIPFVKWGIETGADRVFFTKILNWGTYEEKEFREEISVMKKDGITPIPELREIINRPEMQDPIVDLGTIRYMHKANMDVYIKNYYEWELEKDVPGLFLL